MTDVLAAASASVESYHGASAFTDAALTTKAFADFNTGEAASTTVSAEVAVDLDAWMVNKEDESALAQTYTAPAGDDVTGKSTVRCGVTSSRSKAEKGYDYKMGSTISIKAGYKIRASKTATTSIAAADSTLTEFGLSAYSASGAISQFGSTIALTAAVIATLMAF